MNIFLLFIFFSTLIRYKIATKKNIIAVLWLFPHIAEDWKFGKINIIEEKNY